jgi:hypothetical protein
VSLKPHEREIKLALALIQAERALVFGYLGDLPGGATVRPSAEVSRTKMQLVDDVIRPALKPYTKAVWNHCKPAERDRLLGLPANSFGDDREQDTKSAPTSDRDVDGPEQMA